MHFICRLKLQTLNHSMEEGDVEAIAAASHGYVGADVSALCQEAAMHALGRHVAARESARRSQAGQLQGSSGAVPDSRSEHLAGIEGFRSGSTGAAEPALQVSWHIKSSSTPVWLTSRHGPAWSVRPSMVPI